MLSLKRRDGAGGRGGGVETVSNRSHEGDADDPKRIISFHREDRPDTVAVPPCLSLAQEKTTIIIRGSEDGD